MDLRRPEPEPASIDITWVSCRGVRSSLPFHTPCLYASVCVTSSACGRRRPHRVKTPTDRAGGENPEWDERLRLHFPDDASPASPASDQGAARAEEDHGGVLVVKFELKAEVAVLGDVLAASAVVPVSDLVADGRTRRVSYQLAASSDARQHNGVISFSYAFRFQDDGDQEDKDRRSNGEPLTPPSPASPAASVSSSGMYPVVDWPSMEQLAVYPPLKKQTAVYPPLTAADTATVTRSRYYYPSSTSPPETPVQPAALYPPSTRELSARGIYPTETTPVQPAAIYPPWTRESSARGIYPAVGEPDNGLYPSLDLDPVICYSPATVPCYGGGFRYPAVPDHDARCLYG